MLLTLAVVCFIVAALLGSTLLTFVLYEKPTPRIIALSHGAIAVLGVVLLLIYVYGFQNQIYYLFPGGLFILAAAFGLAVFLKDIRGEKPPKNFALVHVTIAVLAFLILVSFMFLR